MNKLIEQAVNNIYLHIYLIFTFISISTTPLIKLQSELLGDIERNNILIFVTVITMLQIFIDKLDLKKSLNASVWVEFIFIFIIILPLNGLNKEFLITSIIVEGCLALFHINRVYKVQEVLKHYINTSTYNSKINTITGAGICTGYSLNSLITNYIVSKGIYIDSIQMHVDYLILSHVLVFSTVGYLIYINRIILEIVNQKIGE